MNNTALAARFDAPKTSRPLHPTMGQGVAERTYLRRIFTDLQIGDLPGGVVTINPRASTFQKWIVAASNSNIEVVLNDDITAINYEPETRWEEWHEVANRVALGNVSLLPSQLLDGTSHGKDDFGILSKSISNGSLLMSGRHLQQGDINQASRNMEVFTNCSTSPTSFGLFMLLLNGSGVGRDYSDKMMAVDWAEHMPAIVPVLSTDHPDFEWGRHFSSRDAAHLYKTGKDVLTFVVPDTREGWAKAIEKIEVTAYRNAHKGENKIKTLILDFSNVRGKGTPIMGMQGRPSSGPAPLMDAIEKINRIRGTGIKPWLATLYIDHYLAEPVLVGGARRSARMSTKNWRDDDILEFIGIKRPIEYDGLTGEQVEDHYGDGLKPMSFLWSSNNSVAVDADFWKRVRGPITNDPLTQKAKMVFEYVSSCAYSDGTGEPGFINVDRLTTNDTGLDAPEYAAGTYVGSLKYQVTEHTRGLLRELFERFGEMDYHYITNPCGEIVLSILGGFCVIADIVPFYADSLEDAIETARAAVRALIRVNTMDSIYNVEVRRTNRIGVGVTGIHETAWKFFNVGFRDLVQPNMIGWANARVSGFSKETLRTHDEPRIRAAAFWDWMGHLANCCYTESISYAGFLGVNQPHTVMTVKPSGSVSKLFGLTEGWHLPAMRHYIRWVQYHKDSPMIEKYREVGYPVKELKSYRDHFIVGFPTEPALCALDGVHDHIVTAAEASMEDQFRWLRLGEFFLMEGGTIADFIEYAGSLDGLLEARGHAFGNQISYTMKYLPEETSFETFKKMLKDHQSGVRCASVMPQTKNGSYEYLPEMQVTLVEYEAALSAIKREEDTVSEDVGLEHLDCAGGACPIVFDATDKADL